MCVTIGATPSIRPCHPRAGIGCLRISKSAQKILRLISESLRIPMHNGLPSSRDRRKESSDGTSVVCQYLPVAVVAWVRWRFPKLSMQAVAYPCRRYAEYIDQTKGDDGMCSPTVMSDTMRGRFQNHLSPHPRKESIFQCPSKRGGYTSINHIIARIKQDNIQRLCHAK